MPASTKVGAGAGLLIALGLRRANVVVRKAFTGMSMQRVGGYKKPFTSLVSGVNKSSGLSTSAR
jgi:hypothetical protein